MGIKSGGTDPHKVLSSIQHELVNGGKISAAYIPGRTGADVLKALKHTWQLVVHLWIFRTQKEDRQKHYENRVSLVKRELDSVQWERKYVSYCLYY